MLYVNATEENGGVPYKHSLMPAVGKIRWVEDGKYGIKFQLDSTTVFLNYSSKLGSMSVIYQALIASNNKDVSVLYKPTIPRKGFEGDVYHNVWQIEIDGKVILPYEDAEKAWRNNELWLWLVIPLFLIGGPYIGWNSWKKLATCQM